MNPHLCPLTFTQDFMQFLITKKVNPASSIWVCEEVVPVWGWTQLWHQNSHFQFLIISFKQWFRELAPSNGRLFLFILPRCSSSGLWCPSKLHLRTPSYFLSQEWVGNGAGDGCSISLDARFASACRGQKEAKQKAKGDLTPTCGHLLLGVAQQTRSIRFRGWEAWSWRRESVWSSCSPVRFFRHV